MNKNLEINQTIIAQCTPSGSGAIALIRLCGKNVRALVEKISNLPGNKKITQLPTNTIHFGSITDKNKKCIDQVMFLIMDGPKTFTGENTIEITCHNNTFIIENIINLAIENGARIAQPGEFTKLALQNKKIDLLQAEAINELIHANTQLALKKSLAQLEGSFSNYISKIETELIRSLAWCEASFEFLDEEVEFGNKIKENLEKLIKKIHEIKKTFDFQQQIRNGIKVALIGSVNAGKSSIFNSLLNQKRSIVTNIAGTTRDVIEAGLYRNGNYWTLIDTAGLRKTNNVIEKEGINKSFEEAKKADLILLIFDGSNNLSEDKLDIYKKIINDYQQKIIIIQNKSDLKEYSNNQLKDLADIKFSSKTKENIDLLENLINKKICKLFNEIESPFLLNKRQFNIILNVEKKLKIIINLLKDQINYEIVSYHLQETIEHLSELTGKSISEAGMDMIFKEFCVGK